MLNRTGIGKSPEKEALLLALRTILYATDFSKRSQDALGLACALARDYGARLIILHVVVVPTVAYGEGMVPPNPEELQAAAQDQLDLLQVPYSFPNSVWERDKSSASQRARAASCIRLALA